jgi:hypothetical protein
MLADAVRATPISIRLAVDGNRDGDLAFDASDATSKARAYRFWLNNDTDQPEDDVQGAPDSNDLKINNVRDLEDFSRVQIRISDTLNLLDADEEWTVRLQFSDTHSGSPEVNLFSAVGFGPDYLADLEVANEQVQRGQSTIGGNPEMLWITEGTAQTVSVNRFFGGLNLPDPTNTAAFLFEGRTAGKGALTLRVYKDDHLIGESKVWIELRDIKDMYEHWTVGDTTEIALTQIPLVPSRVGTFEYDENSPEDNDYIVFVHGWNMEPHRRRAFAETSFKRLFWQKYDGRFALFSWPTEVGVTTYNVSERKAYASAFGLWRLFTDLNDLYPGKVRVLAHSMGNIVVSEALRHEVESPTPQVIIHTYAASQAAVAAHAYFAAAPERDPPIPNGWQTPEVYANYPPTPGVPYYANIDSAAASLVNFFNPDDDALGWWNFNQGIKPTLGYGYVAGLGFIRDPGLQIMTFPNDTYEIYSHAAQARSQALGRVADVQGPFDVDDQIDLSADPFGYTGAQEDHSAQFLSTNVGRRSYWETIMRRFGLLDT